MLPAFCNVCGTLLVLAVIALAAPLAVPRALGYGVFNVESGSMEPAVPLGSVVYVRGVEPADVAVGEVIAFHDGGDVVVHRVTANRTSLGEFSTRGDANEVDDLAPVPYAALVGRVEGHVPRLGAFMGVYASTVGKVYLLLAATCGVMLNLLAGAMRRARGGRSAQAAQARGRETAQRRSGWALRAVTAVLAVVFLGSAGTVAYVAWRYHEADAPYQGASDSFTGAAGAEEPAGQGVKTASAPARAPIDVDFDALCAVNPDVVGWLWCEGTVIDYPVLQGADNDFYLHHDYTGAENVNGAIFADSDNTSPFTGGNTIVYGHHMNSGSMFATLDAWADPAFFDAHREMWLLTPAGDYRVVLFSGHHTTAASAFYDLVNEPGAALDALLAQAQAASDVAADMALDPAAAYVMLSTCDYRADDDRYVLHGMLVPAM